MDFLKMCLVLTLCVTLMTTAVFSAPAYGDEIETDDFQPDFDADLALIRERRDNDGETDGFLSRFRRQVAQMARNHKTYVGRGHGRSRSRANGRRRYISLRNARTRGRAENW